MMGLIGMVPLLLRLSAPPLAAENEINPGRWAKNLPSDTRFTVLVELNNESVWGNNTGLCRRSPEVGIFLTGPEPSAILPPVKWGAGNAGHCRCGSNWRVWWIPIRAFAREGGYVCRMAIRSKTCSRPTIGRRRRLRALPRSRGS